ncbi:MAG TPA: DUF2179 domain-containing protein [Bacillota bacterium]|nr:DUF2179 domain-containing protein [Bacillota bacterium]
MPLVLTYVVIFFSRIFDVSLGTLRIIYLTRGQSKLAAAIGFVEVMIYVVALSMVINNLDHPLNILIYGLGFACGNYIGSLIEEKVAVGYVNVQVISKKSNGELEHSLRELGFGVTSMDCYGKDGPHRILHILIKRKILPLFLDKLRQLDHDAFISIIDTRKIMGGYFTRMKAK